MEQFARSRATARAQRHRSLRRATIILRGSGASACASTVKEMATAEQVQEALQQLQVLPARIAALETQLQFESARAQQAEQERSALIQALGAMRTNRGDAMVDTKGIGQPFS